MVVREIPRPRRHTPSRRTVIVVTIVLLLLGARTIASYVIDYQWWKEMGQLSTWGAMLLYGTAPMLGAFLITLAVLWMSHARGMMQGGTRLREHPLYARLTGFVLLVVAAIIALGNIDNWNVVQYFGAMSLPADAASWHDPVFNKPLAFYLFEVPFYSDLLGWVLGVIFTAALIYWITAQGWHLRSQFPTWEGGPIHLEFRDLRLERALDSQFVRMLAALFLLGLAVRFYLARYSMLLDDHRFMVGIDYTDEKITLLLQWSIIGACVIAAVLVVSRQAKWALLAVVVLIVRIAAPAAVSALYVKPNEISLERPYIQRHIEATRAAFGIDSRVKEQQFPAKLEAHIDPNKHKNLLENVRLWDWRAFHDTITQIQALRQYYVFNDTDVDRYTIDGQLRQVLLTPRELDIHQLADARSNWINGHFIYTHGYGVVMAEANKITPSGSPVLLIQDAPPKVNTTSLKLTRPEIYFGEVTHEPVFVGTKQPEFNYPSGAENVHTEYAASGGIPIASLPMRLAGGILYGDFNMLLTGYFEPRSRMLIHRNVRERLQTLAHFIEWDADPYLVIDKNGALVWMVDGFTASGRHPYSRSVDLKSFGTTNYIRNSVKATVNAYDGRVTLYIFDPADPIIRAWQAIFPALFRPASEMPADLRAHTRYPVPLFLSQSEIYRTYHMRDPESFYNKEDLWDFGKNVYGQNAKPEMVMPTFVVATLPGEDKPEFLLMEPFTPRSKDNMIGVVMARCDGEHLGEMVVLQLSKQNLMYGPLQMEARIDSDQNISKDLTLWNQQGSSVLRGQMIVLPIEDTFLYVEPIYIQSSQARMPQLKKVVVAMGNTIIYRDTYEQAMADLGVNMAPRSGAEQAPTGPQTAAAGAGPPNAAVQQPVSPGGKDARIDEIRGHLQHYRELAAQGKWAEAGKELEAVESLVRR
jgi:uncharacterized membrane protein (UPF0182 family)